MSAQQIHRFSGIAMIALSLLALLTVLSGFTQPPQPDEGAGAHVFQLSILALLPTVLVYVATGDWSRPARSARPLALSGALVVFAFVALYHLEHSR